MGGIESGWWTVTPEDNRKKVICPICGGSGVDHRLNECRICHGTGEVFERKEK